MRRIFVELSQALAPERVRMKVSVRTLLEMLLLAVLYVGAGKLGLSLAHENASVSPVWPPTGLALAALLIRGRRLWPAVFVGAFVVNVTTAPKNPVPAIYWVAGSLLIAAGNTLEAVLGEWLVRRFAAGKAAFNRASDVIRFFCLAIPSTAVSAIIGILTLCVIDPAAWKEIMPLGATWWTGDYVSDLLVAPLLIILAGGALPRYRLPRLLEAGGMIVLTVAASAFTFLQPPPSLGGNFLLPLLLLAAFRFQQWGAILSATIMSIIATVGTYYGLGPFSTDDLNTSPLLLQAFVGFRAVTALILAAVVAERLRERDEKEAALAAERKARAEAERANKAKDEFLAVLSHELRTPLAPVLLTASLLENDARVPEGVRADLRQIRENTTLEARLIDDLLDHSRITSGKMTLELQVVDVQEIVRRAAQICGAQRNGDLTLALEAGAPGVYGDAARLQQIFWNLINNALKFTPAGRPIVVRAYNPDAATVRVDVRDAGIGIEPELLPRMFEAFEQGDVRSAGKGGLGLGLTITRALVEAHGGRVTAFSQGRDQGTTFTVELAVCTTARAEKAAPQRPPAPAAAKGRRVLLVEDHADTRRAMVRLLSALGHHVTAAENAQAAVASAEAGTFELVISDIGLPDASGLDLMRRLRPMFSGRGETVWAIAVSGYGREEDVRASKEAGFDAHLTKPVSPDRLILAMESATAGAR